MRIERRAVTEVAVVIGAGVGLALGAGAHAVLEPTLEAADGLVRELQGLVWNLVPLGTVGGGLFGWWVARRRSSDGAP